MQLLDHHWINKGSTVEILYGDHRSFNGIIREFEVVAMDLSKPQTAQGLNYFIVDVYGEMQSICQSALRLLKKPGYTQIKPGVWKADYLLAGDERYYSGSATSVEYNHTNQEQESSKWPFSTALWTTQPKPVLQLMKLNFKPML